MARIDLIDAMLIFVVVCAGIAFIFPLGHSDLPEVIVPQDLPIEGLDDQSVSNCIHLENGKKLCKLGTVTIDNGKISNEAQEARF